MGTRPTLLFAQLGTRIILVHGDEPPAPAEWSRYATVLNELFRDGGEGILVVSRGAGPNALQREQIVGVAMPAAVVTSSRLGRGIVTAIRWFTPTIKAFAPRELHKAYAFLGLKETHHLAFSRKVIELQLELEGRDANLASTLPQEELEKMVCQPALGVVR